MADGDLLNFSGANNSTTTEGIILPQGTDVSAGTAEGQVGWDSDNDRLLIGNGAAPVRVGCFVIGNNQSGGNTATFWQAPFASQSTTETNLDMWEVPTNLPLVATDLHCEVNTAPDTGGGTQSWACSANVDNTASSDLTCTISETAVECDDSGAVALAVGAVLNTEFLASGTPASNGGASHSIVLCPQ